MPTEYYETKGRVEKIAIWPMKSSRYHLARFYLTGLGGKNTLIRVRYY